MKKIRFIWVVLLLLCLSACAKEKVSEQGTYGTEESTVDWRGQEFQVQENVARNWTIWMDKFNLIDISDMVSSDESVFMSIYLGQFGERYIIFTSCIIKKARTAGMPVSASILRI